MALAGTKLPKRFMFKIEAMYAAKHPAIDKFYGEKIQFWIISAYTFITLILSIELLVSGRYNPFLYFRF